MNMRDMVVPFVFAVATTWLIQHFFFGKPSEVHNYQFSAPQSAVECKPLNKEISFAPDEKRMSELPIHIKTNWGTLEFSPIGASLERLTFNRKINGDVREITTVYPVELDEKAHKAFLIALDNNTPLYYSLVDSHDSDDAVYVTFKASSSAATIVKQFTVNKKTYNIDLSVMVDPKDKTTVRLTYPAPIMPELKDQQLVSADIWVGLDTFKKIARESLKPDEGWLNPSLLGVENKYFVHALFSDKDNFAQRAYFYKSGTDRLQAFVESAVIDTAHTWHFSFYVGPKESSAMAAVDDRLEKTLDYSGMWAPISRMLLALLDWIYQYVHNYGLAIIVLTLLIKLVLLPFSIRAERGMKDRVEMQRRLQYIQQKFKDDPQGKAQAQAEFMRKHGLGLAGCLPMLLQVPIFFGLSRVLSSSIQLYQAPFLWMKDLSAYDPYYILPVLVMVGMLATAFTATDAKQRLPIIAMSLMFGAVSASFSAGLVLYIALSTVLNVVQSRLFALLNVV